MADNSSVGHPSTAESTDPAVALLVENHRAFLGFVERRVGSHELAEDILQAAFGRAVRRPPAVSDRESIVAWFYRVLRNAVIDEYRRDTTSKRTLEALARELETVQPASEVHGVVCACVGTLAAGLKPEYAEALRRIDVEGTPVKEYATQVGISANNAAVRVFRARKALRKQVVVSCGTCADHGCADCSCSPRTPARS